MDVLIDNQQSDLWLSDAEIVTLSREVVSFEGHSFDEVSLQFVTHERICELHDYFFDDPTPTDCISLPMDSADEPGYKVLGEIFVCPKTAISYAEENGVNAYDEVTLYIVHGLLHLMGYQDDLEHVDEMRAAEKRHLENLSLKKLILTPKEESCS